MLLYRLWKTLSLQNNLVTNAFSSAAINFMFRRVFLLPNIFASIFVLCIDLWSINTFVAFTSNSFLDFTRTAARCVFSHPISMHTLFVYVFVYECFCEMYDVDDNKCKGRRREMDRWIGRKESIAFYEQKQTNQLSIAITITAAPQQLRIPILIQIYK